MIERSSMQNIHPEVSAIAVLSQDLFAQLSTFIYDTCGIKMPPTKKTMLEARLIKRMRSLGLASFQEYCRYLFSPEGEAKELVHMIDAVTTNKTDFFREPQHFEYLLNKAIPDIIAGIGTGIRKTFTVWSAACSSGEEVYTLTMVLEEFARTRPGFNYMVLGTDISTKVLETAKAAIYDEERIIPIPLDLRQRYLLRSKDPKRKDVRIIPELRAKARFRWLNFMDKDLDSEKRWMSFFAGTCLSISIGPLRKRS